MDLDKHWGSILLGAAVVGTVAFASVLSHSASMVEQEGDPLGEDEFEPSESTALGAYMNKRREKVGPQGIDKHASKYLASKYGGLGRYFGRG